MKVSLNWVKKYVDLPDYITTKQIATDLTLRTVEVEGYENTEEKFHDIIVGKILEVNEHPNADKLRVCKVDIGDGEPKQIVCGGSNLYTNEMVVVCKPGAEVYWHGESELMKIKDSKVRGVDSYGMICGAEEVYLENIFPAKDEDEIVDLAGIDCYPGQSITEIIDMKDVVLEIDNKSLTNRPDLWGHYGIARELSAIYDVDLKPIEKVKIDSNLPKYDVVIEDTTKCQRYVAVEIDNVYEKRSPLWMQSAIIKGGMRPINAIVDITNYVMMAVGQPLHAFDKTHVDGNKIIVRNARDGEELLLLDNNTIELTTDDLVISDSKDAMALAGIRGGKKDSILPETTGVVLEVANFTAKTIRKTGKRFDEKTDASIRYEKNLDTQRVEEGLNLALALFKEIFPESKIVAFNDVYPVKTKNEKINVSEEFLDTRLGKKIDRETITRVLTRLGYEVNYKNGIYTVVVPTYRSTGDVSLKDDVMGDIARLLSFESFEAQPLTISFDHAVLQNKVLLETRIKEYLSNRCGFYEIFTYPWINEKYIDAASLNKEVSIKLATPPSPEEAYLRSSLVPGMLEAISKNLRYFDSFKMFEMAQVFIKGEYHESSEDETLPIHKKLLTGSIVGSNPKEIFYELKGVIENISRYTHMKELNFTTECEKPSWADINAYLAIKLDNEIVGYMGLLSVKTMNDAKIKRTNVAIFELDSDMFIPLESRTNKFKHIPVLPSVEKDLSLIVDENITWADMTKYIRSKASDIKFIEEYRGNQIPKGKKSIMLRVTFDSGDTTLTSEEINTKLDAIIRTLNKMCGAVLREE
ncbi:MAG: phenylalanine--tRNA ligase subunit beta [Mollicutes bacterium]|nr:phenylalanine--tRNA ligase subunit beta [Mollicutes bacterium]